MSQTPKLSDALPGADLLFDRATLEREIARMAGQIDLDYAGDHPLFLTVMHGGMLFASLLALQIKLAVRDACLREGAKEVRSAVLTSKLHDRRVPGIAADYIGVELPDRYVFGFGMDYYEQGRNLPGIYAI